MSAAARTWTCPECQEPLTAAAQTQGQADLALTAVALEHLETRHPTSRGLTNAHAQTSGWLSPAGHLVTLWGGPEDGAELWLPPGERPAALGVQRDEQGHLHPLRSATGLLMPGVTTYRLGELDARLGAGRGFRYMYDGRPR